MVAAANMVEIAALVGDTARVTMLTALMGGQALTSSELAGLARVSRATASEHLSKLTQARLLAVTKSGATAIIGLPHLWWRKCWKASRRSPHWRRRRAISRAWRRTMHCVSPALATS